MIVSSKGDRHPGHEVAVLSGATKTYGGVNVVDDVDLVVEAQKTSVLVGPNGSGKTTTVEMLVGLRRLTAGEARIDGMTVVPGGPHRSRVGVQLQSSGLPSKIKVREVIRSVDSLYEYPADWRPMAQTLGVDAYLGATVDNLSGGQRRRLDILCAALGGPRLLVLDEPTSGIDPEGRAVVWDFVHGLSREGCAVLATTHDMAEAEAFADQLLVMAGGRIRLRGTVREVLASLDGDRRLRVTYPPQDVVDLIERSGRPWGRSGSSVVVIGDQQQVLELAGQVESVVDSVRTQVREGPIRLEDVFAVVAGSAEHGGDVDQGEEPLPVSAGTGGDE